MARDKKVHETDHVDPATGETAYGMPRDWGAEEREAGQELPAYMGNRPAVRPSRDPALSMQTEGRATRAPTIHLEVHVTSREKAERLDAALTSACADSHIAKKHNKWTVFADYSVNNAVDVGREIEDFF